MGKNNNQAFNVSRQSRHFEKISTSLEVIKENIDLKSDIDKQQEFTEHLSTISCNLSQVSDNVRSSISSLKSDIENQQNYLESNLSKEFKTQLTTSVNQFRNVASETINDDIGNLNKEEFIEKLTQGFEAVAEKFNDAFEKAADDISSRVTNDLESKIEQTLEKVSSDVDKEVREIHIIKGDILLLCHMPESQDDLC